MFELAADPETTRRFIRARWRAFAISSAVAVPLFVGLMVIENRAFILYLLLLLYPLFAFVGLMRVKGRVGSGGAIGIALVEEGARLTIVRGAGARSSAYRDAHPAGAEVVMIPYAEIAARIGSDSVHLAHARGAAPGRLPAYELYVIPCPAAEGARLGEALASRGVRVHFEQGSRLVGPIVTILFRVTARFVTPVLVLGALANVALAATGNGGSWLLGGILFAAAFALLLVTAILRALFDPASTRR
jgi:hypothetical protein